MRLILIALLVLLGLAGQAVAQARPGPEARPLGDWTDPDLGRAVIEGVATERFLWLRGASGNLVRFDRQTGERKVEAQGVIDILADGPQLWALSKTNQNEAVVKEVRRSVFADRRIYFEGDPVALFATGAEPGVVTNTQVLMPAGDGWSRHRLAATLDPHAHVSALIGDALLVGYNKGEWGGGLRRIDVFTGTVSFVRGAGDGLCGGLLNPECHPMVGIVPDAERVDCALVGASLAHLSGRYGEVLRVCRDTITRVFADTLPARSDSLSPGGTWPFNSIVAVRDGWVAVGQDRYARSRHGTVAMAAVPPFLMWAGLRVSAPSDDVIFMESACCWGSASFIQYRVIAIPVSD